MSLVTTGPTELKNEARMPPPYSLEALSAAAVEACRFGEGFVRPAYESFCFSKLPGFFEHVLLGSSRRGNLPTDVVQRVGHYEHIIFVFFDAFGWESFERFRDSSPILKHIDREGLVLKATSQFPSTTATHVTTAWSGQTAYEHEICGWDYFEPRVGTVIKPLKFSFSNGGLPGSLLSAGFTPQSILPQSVMVPRLLENGVRVTFHGPKSFFPSPFNSAYAAPGGIAGYDFLNQGINNLLEHLRAQHTPSYQSLYIDAYDSACHMEGVGANKPDNVARAILKNLERFIQPSAPPSTLLVLCADHGQIKIVREGSIPINTIIPDLATMLKRDCRCDPIRFSGGSRYLFLHPEPQYEAHLVSLLKNQLRGAATVMTIPELTATGCLGPNEVKSSYIERLGTIAVLPHAGYSVHWHEPPVFRHPDPSNHGGVSPQEMEVPLLLLPLGRAN